MRTRIGLALSHDLIRAVAVRNGVILWAAEGPPASSAPLADRINALLDEAPPTGWLRPWVSAAIGPSAAHLKLIGGLPTAASPETLAAIVRENPGAFFAGDSRALVTTTAVPLAPGVALLGAIDRSDLEAIATVCSQRRWRFTSAAPTAAVLPRAIVENRFSWRDGPVVVDLTRDETRLTSVQRRPAGSDDPATPWPTPVLPLAVLGENSVRFADAYGAALLNRRGPFCIDPETLRSWRDASVRRRYLTPAAMLLLALLSIALSPVAAVWTGFRAEARVAAIRPEQWRSVTSSLEQLDTISRALTEIRQFAEARHQTTDLLAALTRALPDTSALMALHLAEGRGELIVLARDSVATLAAVRRVPGAEAAEFVGPVGRQPVAFGELSRIVIRFGPRATDSTATIDRSAR